MALIIIGLVLSIALTIFFWAVGWNTRPNRTSGRPKISQFPSWAKWMMGLSWLPFVVILAVWVVQSINNQPSSVPGVVTPPSITTPVGICFIYSNSYNPCGCRSKSNHHNYQDTGNYHSHGHSASGDYYTGNHGNNTQQ